MNWLDGVLSPWESNNSVVTGLRAKQKSETEELSSRATHIYLHTLHLKHPFCSCKFCLGEPVAMATLLYCHIFLHEQGQFSMLIAYAFPQVIVVLQPTHYTRLPTRDTSANRSTVVFYRSCKITGISNIVYLYV